MSSDNESELRRRAVARSHELLRRAEQGFACRMPVPAFRFDLRGRAAGQARIAPGRTSELRYNVDLLLAHPAEFLAQTVPHEVAHLVAYQVFGRAIRPHGREWRSVMELFGVPARRCHDYPMEDLPTRRLKRYAYHCACSTHALSSIRHNRWRRGQRYVCRTCGQPLWPGRHPASAAVGADRGGC